MLRGKEELVDNERVIISIACYRHRLLEVGYINPLVHAYYAVGFPRSLSHSSSASDLLLSWLAYSSLDWR